MGAAQQKNARQTGTANKAAFVLASSDFFAIFERIAQIQRGAMEFCAKKNLFWSDFSFGNLK